MEITIGDIQDRMTEDDFRNVFDRDQDGVVNTASGPDFAFLNKCIASACSLMNAALRVGFPGGIDDGVNLIDEAAKSATAMLAVWEGIKFSSLSTGGDDSPLRKNMNEAMEFLKSVRTGEYRLTTALAGAPHVQKASVYGTRDARGCPNAVFTQAATRKRRSAF